MKQSKKFKSSKSVILFLICLVSSSIGFLHGERRDNRRERSDTRLEERDFRTSRKGLVNVLLNRNVAGERLTENDSILGNLYDMRSFRTGSIKDRRQNTRFDENNNLDRHRRSVNDENRRNDRTRRQELLSRELDRVRIPVSRFSTDSDRSSTVERQDLFRTIKREVRRDLSRESRSSLQRDSDRAFNSRENTLPEERRSAQRDTDRSEASRIFSRTSERRSSLFRTIKREVRRDLSRESRSSIQRDYDRAFSSRENAFPEERRSAQRDTDRSEASRIFSRTSERRASLRDTTRRDLSSEDRRSLLTRAETTRNARGQNLLRRLMSNYRDETRQSRDMSRSDSTRQAPARSSTSFDFRRERFDRRIMDSFTRDEHRSVPSTVNNNFQRQDNTRSNLRDGRLSSEDRRSLRTNIDSTIRNYRGQNLLRTLVSNARKPTNQVDEARESRDTFRSDSTRQTRDRSSISSGIRRERFDRRITDIFRSRNRVLDSFTRDERREASERREDTSREETRTNNRERIDALTRHTTDQLRREIRDAREASERREDTSREETRTNNRERIDALTRHTTDQLRREIRDARDTSDRKADSTRRATRDLEESRHRQSGVNSRRETIRFARSSSRSTMDRTRRFLANSLDRRDFRTSSDITDRRLSSSDERQHRADSTRLLSGSRRSQEVSRSARVAPDERRDYRTSPDFSRMERIDENPQDFRKDLSNVHTERIDLTTSPKIDVFLYPSDERRSSRSLFRESLSSRNSFAVPEMNDYSTDSKSAWVALANTAKIILSIYLIGQIFLDQSSKKTKFRFQNIISPLGLVKEKVQ